ncbi:Mov34/MPN/PAD-1 family protein [Sphingomonas sp. BK036]|uniref:Mov34/MPN/PAD-1 family protein n=1 Tax=Sphingomonas sp. BK036 TaxID=2512122 RepID=UPI00102A5B78|nr:Mov34/MPN/PAD-1 family protein [Sphingomonas sp. BK036]
MRLAMPHEFRTRLHEVVKEAGRREIGGVLMAEQIEPGSFRLVDFSVDSRSGGAAHFVRSVEHHQEALAAFFERTGSDYGRFNYLGEWHSHPNHLPVPSGEDTASMRDLVGGERDIPFAVLLIVRASRRGLMCTATLFEHGADAAEVALQPE